MFVLRLLVFCFIGVLRSVDTILVHLGEYILRVGKSTFLYVEKIKVCNLDQVVANQPQILHVIGCKEVLLDHTGILMLFDVTFVE